MHAICRQCVQCSRGFHRHVQHMRRLVPTSATCYKTHCPHSTSPRCTWEHKPMMEPATCQTNTRVVRPWSRQFNHWRTTRIAVHTTRTWSVLRPSRVHRSYAMLWTWCRNWACSTNVLGLLGVSTADRVPQTLQHSATRSGDNCCRDLRLLRCNIDMKFYAFFEAAIDKTQQWATHLTVP